MSDYLGVVTTQGQQKLAASVGGTPLNLTTVRVGDGNGAPITPTTAMTDLVRRVGNAYPVTSSGRDPLNPQAWRITAEIPETEGPFDIREIGVFDASGTMIAIARHVLVEKRTPDQGAAVGLVTDIVFPVSDTAQVSVNIQPSAATDIAELLRPPFLVVESATVVSPPANPAPGRTHVVPTGATGVWSGYAGYLAQWNGTVWAMANPPVGHLVVVADAAEGAAGRFQRRTAGGWVNATASETAYGLAVLATDAEHLLGLTDQEAAHPKGVKAMIDAAITALVNGAPVTLDTLKEIADVLGTLFATILEHVAGTRQDRATTPKGVAQTAQSGAWNWVGVFGGTANALTGTLTPTPDAIAPGLVVRGIVASTNTGEATFALTGYQPATIYVDGVATTGGELIAGTGIELVPAAGGWRLRREVSPVTILQALFAKPLSTLSVSSPQGPFGNGAYGVPNSYAVVVDNLDPADGHWDNASGIVTVLKGGTWTANWSFELPEGSATLLLMILLKNGGQIAPAQDASAAGFKRMCVSHSGQYSPNDTIAPASYITSGVASRVLNGAVFSVCRLR